MPGSYVLITPARNEAATIGDVIEAVAGQTHPPARWVIVDDGSGDGTRAIVDEATRRYPFISLVDRADRGRDDVGGGVVDAFMAGAAVLGGDIDAVAYLGKLDADVVPAPDYFERLCLRLDQAPALGIASGQNWVRTGAGRLRREAFASFHPIGSARLWRTSVYRAIGGLVPAPGWDTLDLIRAQRHGYDTRAFDELPVVHLRGMGRRGALREATERLGRISFLLGYHPLYFAARVAQYATRPPVLLRSSWLVLGYLAAWRRGEPRIVTAEERRWLRRNQLRRLIGRRR
jgi:glycosyltransferase involved in cell wall biosynthesis